jgi:hypothetical protein
MNSENERLKLKATFWNSLAVAAAVGGVVLPALNGYGDDAVYNSTVFPVLSPVAWKFFTSMAAGFVISAGLRIYADHIIRQIKD